MPHPLDDPFNHRHLCDWLDRVYPDASDWMEVYEAVNALLESDPDLINDHSWPEIVLMALPELA